jgi:hypothetical protein
MLSKNAQEERQLKQELVRRTASGRSLKDATTDVRDFIQDFENRFNSADVMEKRELLNKWIAWIELDPEKRVAERVVRKLPSLNPAFTELSQNAIEHEKATLSESPFSQNFVAGTGTSDSAKLYMSFSKEI